MRTRRRATSVVVAVVLSTVLGGTSSCAVNPVTGEPQLSLVSRSQEIQMGRQADQDVVRSMGIYDDPPLQSYISALGKRMAALTERPDLPWTFRLVDDPAVNAFSLPGGFVYMTRGILPYLASEAQLAAVMGHEIGHVTARHSVSQISRQELASLGLGIGSILSPRVARFQRVLSGGLRLAFLKFSRDDESQADRLGLRYMTAAGFDPTQMPGVFRMLGRVGARSGSSTPEWLATHPDPGNREEAIRKQIAGMSVDPDTLVVGTDDYVRRLDGLVFGEDPRNGYFQGATFIQPKLRFRFDFPDGWQTVNQAQEVAGQAKSGDAAVTITFADSTGGREALRAFLAQDGVEAGSTSFREIHGLPTSRAFFSARTQQGELQGIVAFVEYGGRVYRLLGYATEDRFAIYRNALEDALSSFDAVRDPKLLSVEPKRVRIVRLPNPMTLAEFNRRYPSTLPIDQLAILNQVRSDQTLKADRLVKRVTGTGMPAAN